MQGTGTVIHLNFRAGSTFPVPVCTVPSSMIRTSRCNKVDGLDAVRLYASYRLNLLLLKGQRFVKYKTVFRQSWFGRHDIFCLQACRMLVSKYKPLQSVEWKNRLCKLCIYCVSWRIEFFKFRLFAQSYNRYC